jgi:D-alanine-D-alanine ligase
MFPRRIAILVNTDFAERAREPIAGPRAFEADAAVLETARAVAAALRASNVEVVELEVTNTLAGVVERIAASGAELVFNLVESVDNDYGREWEIPALLDRHGVRYTGNGALPLQVCREKDRARARLAREGVRVAPAIVVDDVRALDAAAVALSFPCFVKPARVDGSIGIDAESICADVEALARRLAVLEAVLPGPYLVEEFLPGKEINVALFPEPVRGYVVATEIDFSAVPPERPHIVTYDAKWNPESPDYASRSVPAALAPALAAEVERQARAAFRALGGTGYGRVDMRLDRNGQPCVIDVNPNNDLHPDAGLAAAARSVDVSYEALIRAIVTAAQGDNTCT